MWRSVLGPHVFGNSPLSVRFKCAIAHLLPMQEVHRPGAWQAKTITRIMLKYMIWHHIMKANHGTQYISHNVHF